MAHYSSVDDAVRRQRSYPALDRDLANHDFQRRRVASCVQYINPHDVVLDVACNTGYFRDYVPYPSVEIHGVDVNPDHVEVAATRLTSARLATAEHLPFLPHTFDVVNLSGLLEQVFDPALVVKEAARVCRRYIIGNTTHESGTWGKHRIERHEWQSKSYSESEIRSLLEPHGTLLYLGTVDAGSPPSPQCWCWCVDVRSPQ